MRIVISGTYSTGKTTTALALSLLTGIEATHGSTMREILPVAFPGKRLEECDFHELMELGMRRFTERVIVEKRRGNSFISDGCPMQEWLYATTRMITGLNPAEKRWKIRLHKLMYAPEWEVFKDSVAGFGTVAQQYAKNHYDAFIHLPVEFPFTPDGHRPTSESFRQKSEELLLKTYTELGLTVFTAKGTIEERLKSIIAHLGLSPVMSVEEAVTKAINMKTKKFDSIKMETDKILKGTVYDLF
jgi:hypothetical protein